MDITRLQEAFDFTAEDLEANRKGLRGKGQTDYGPIMSRRYVKETAGLALLLSAAVIYMWIDKGFLMAVGLSVIVVMVVGSYWHAQHKIYKWGIEQIGLLDNGEFKRLDSFKKGDVETSQQGQNTLRAIPVGNIKLYMSDEAYAVLEDGVNYRVYYWRWLDKENTPNAEILSIEPFD